MKPNWNHYGKKAVRVLRVLRGDKRHEVAEWSVDALLEGDFDDAYLSDDNSAVVPTDTVKNTVHALAHDETVLNRDAFAARLALHFSAKYPVVAAAEVEVRERVWQRAAPGGTSHAHVFTADLNGTPYGFARTEGDRVVRCGGGIRDWMLMKTTASGFSGFPRCDLTTLPETDDRILATSMTAQWETDTPCAEPLDGLLQTKALEIFAQKFSPSVQRTLHEIGEAFLADAPVARRVRLTMPNKHYLPLDLGALGRGSDQREIFLPSDEPYGFIEAEITR